MLQCTKVNMAEKLNLCDNQKEDQVITQVYYGQTYQRRIKILWCRLRSIHQSQGLYLLF